MLAAILFSLASFQEPAMVRTWTVQTGNDTSILGSRDGVCYYASTNFVGAVRESDGKSLWEKPYRSIAASHLGPSFIVLSHGDEKNALLVMLDLKRGTQLASRSTPIAGALTVDATTTYALSGATLSLFNSTLAPVTKIKLAEQAPRMPGQLAISGDLLVVALDGDRWLVLNKKTRKKLWERRDQYAGSNPMILSKDLLLLRGESEGAFHARSGRKAWSLSSTGWARLSGNVCLFLEGTSYVGRDWTTGRVLWRLSGAPDYTGGNNEVSLSEDGKMFLAGGDRLVAMSLAGKKLWTSNLSRPDIARKDRWIVSENDRLLGYAPGKMVQIPSDADGRNKLATQLVRDFELLDDRERDLLVPLAREAVRPLLDRYVQWANEMESLEGKSYSSTRDRGLTLYGLLEADSVKRLEKMLTKADTPLLLSTIQQVKAEWWRQRVLVPMMLAHGDLEQAAPFFLEQLRKEKDPERQSSSLAAISKSKHPEAVKFLIDALNDPKAPSAWRRAAFLNLAGTAAEAGIEAIRSATPKPGPRPRWQSRVNPLAKTGRDMPREAKDAKGRSWILFQSGVLGNESDYFMAQKVSSKLGEAIFLGFYDGRTWGKEPSKMHRKIPMAKLTSAEWIKIFPDDAEVRKDTDSDGLTDLVENRLGTNPKVEDTDRDGLKDNVDPCPNAAPRSMGDREKIIAAAVAAHFFEIDWRVPAVISVAKVLPFEMTGYPQPLIWTVGGREGNLGSMYGAGVNVISFEPVRRDFSQRIPKGTDWLKISADGKTANTMISRYSGGLNGEGVDVVLRKVGDEWFVTDLITVYVS